MSSLASCASPLKLSTPLNTDAWSAFRAATPQKTPSSNKQGGLRADPWATVRSGACLDTVRRIGLSASRPASRPSQKFVVLAPLDLGDVNYASGSCGALFQWLRELVLDRAKHATLLHEMILAKEDLAAAEEAHGLAEQRLEETQAELEANRMEQSSQEQLLAKMQHTPCHGSTPTPT